MPSAEAVPVISFYLNSAESAGEVPEEDHSEKPGFLAFALECIRKTEGEEKNASGNVRASVVRDRLMSIPEFRAALKKSRMKPMMYMQQLFAGRIRIWLEKGVFRAAPEDALEEASADQCRVDELAERRKVFYEKAFSNIQRQLTDAGLEEETVDEIAGILLRPDSVAEPRKAIHTFLCRRFGPKIGAKYYRQTVKYMSV